MGKPKQQDKKSEGGDGEKGNDTLHRVKKLSASSTSSSGNGEKGPSPGCSSGVRTRTQDVEGIPQIVEEKTMIKVNI